VISIDHIVDENDHNVYTDNVITVLMPLLVLENLTKSVL
jgi:hypothetical protein